MAFWLGPKLCGHPGIVHGGLTASLIDEVSGETSIVTTGPGPFTANINVNYTRPLIADSWVRVSGRVVRKEGRKTWVEVRVTDGVGGEAGVEYANATVLFVRPKWMPEGKRPRAVDAIRAHSEQQAKAKQEIAA